MSSFKRTRKGLVVARFDEVEAALLRHLVTEVSDLLEPDQPPDPPSAEPAGAGAVPDDAQLAELTGMGGPVPEPSADPVLQRLLPDGYREDPAAAEEFRRFTEAGLREQKLATAAKLLADLPGDGPGEVTFDNPTVERWLTGLNDVRLSLGTRIGITEDMPEPAADHPDAPSYAVYLWLTELQEVLVQIAAED